jgi:hypothetical protein
VSDWGSSADLDFRDRNNVTESNQPDTNADVTTQTHDYLTGAYDERLRIIKLLEEDADNNYYALQLIKGENK